MKPIMEPHHPVLDPSKIPFGKQFTDRFLVMNYRDGRWQQPRLAFYKEERLELHPGAGVFHYGQSIFEGLKAYRRVNGRIGLFRPDMNAARFNRSAERLSMPSLDPDLFIRYTQDLVLAERDWIPSEPGSLYLRPAMFASEASLAVRSATEFIFFVLALPVGAYFPEAPPGAGSIKVYVSESISRGSKGGTGGFKTAANYAGTLKPIAEAKHLGCSQALFLDACSGKYVEEMGGMNVLFVRNGVLMTPPLFDTILPGVTRDSVLHLARQMGVEVSEAPILMEEIAAGIEDGSVTEALACGTAAIVTGIGSFLFESGRTHAFKQPVPGPLTSALYKRIRDIQYGHAPDTNGWTVDLPE
jgi:branched-chain amino acid aminotransferase